MTRKRGGPALRGGPLSIVTQTNRKAEGVMMNVTVIRYDLGDFSIQLSCIKKKIFPLTEV